VLIARRLPSYGLSPKPATVAVETGVEQKQQEATAPKPVETEPAKVPPGVQAKLSVAEQRRLKRQQKMARNRELAAESRIRRKRLLEDLTKENEMLRARLAKLEGSGNLEEGQNLNLEGSQNSGNSKRLRIDDGLPMHLPSTSSSSSSSRREISIQTDESWLLQTTKLTTAAVGLALSAVLVAMDTSAVGAPESGTNGTTFEVQLIAVWAMVAELFRWLFGGGPVVAPAGLEHHHLEHQHQHLHLQQRGSHVMHSTSMHAGDVRWLIWISLLGATLLLVVAVVGLAWLTKARKATMMYYEPEWQHLYSWRKTQKCLG
jgi:hypothetical protein